MPIDVWAWLTFFNKTLLYGSTAAVVGGHFSLALYNNHGEPRTSSYSYLRLSSGIGVLAAVTFFFIQVGSFAEAGFSGLFDLTLVKILLHSTVGYSSVLQASGFLLLALLGIGFKKAGPTLVYWVIATIAMSMIIGAYLLVGHLVNYAIAIRLILGLHLVAISLWIGSLYPLLNIALHGEPHRTQLIMQRFGNLATIFVGVLIVCGIALAYLLVGSWANLVNSNYGRALLLKLACVVILLGLAAANKLQWVPHLLKSGVSRRLAQSITVEIIVAAAIITATAAMTTLIGIGHK